MNDQKDSHSAAPDDMIIKSHTAHLDDAEGQKPNAAWEQLVREAQIAEEEEKNMPLREAFRVYPKAMFWTFAVTMCFVMAAFDQSIFGSIIGLPSFREKYGSFSEKAGGYQLDPSWQTGLGKAAGTGSFIGIIISGWAQARFGYRRTLQVGITWLAGAITITFCAKDIQMLFAGELLSGLTFGAFTTSAIGYASEIAPVPLRAFLSSYIALVNSFGQLLAAGVFQGISQSGISGQWSYRIPFAVQWVWVVPIFLIATFAPESPWFLVRAGRLEEAEATVKRLGKKTNHRDPAGIVAMMVRTNEHEKQTAEGTGFKSYLQCFKGSNLRRTEIACVTMCMIPLCGDWFFGGGAYFFEQAGLSTKDSFSFNMGLWGFACFGTVAAWFVVPYVGRRRLMMGGLFVIAAILFLVGILTVTVRKGNGAARWAQAALILVCIFAFNVAVAPLVYVIVGECSSTRLRGQTIAIARNTYILCALPVAFISNYAMNPAAWAWGTYSGLFWCGTCLTLPLWAFFRLPETKGRSFRELDIMFEDHVSARKFKSTTVADDEEAPNAASVEKQQ